MDKVAKIVAIVNQKGGVGKTTTCVNLAAALKYLGKRVLLCDFDPQANATSGMGVDKSVSNGVYDVLINGVETRKAIVTTPYGDVLPSSKALAGGGVEMIEMADRQFLLRSALDAVREDYDYIFVDCPPIDIVADTQIIEKATDRTLFVVRAGLLERSMLSELENIYREKRFKNLAMILNGTERSHGRYSYRYGYHYGSYYHSGK